MHVTFAFQCFQLMSWDRLCRDESHKVATSVHFVNLSPRRFIRTHSYNTIVADLIIVKESL